MTISVLYLTKDKEISFNFPDVNCPVRTALINNLNINNIKFLDMGVVILVPAAAFKSVADLESRALNGFQYTPHQVWDTNGATMHFYYGDVSLTNEENSKKIRKISSKILLEESYVPSRGTGSVRLPTSAKDIPRQEAGVFSKLKSALLGDNKKTEKRDEPKSGLKK